MEVTLFIPCSIDQIRPELGWQMIELLEGMSCTVQYVQNQTCCGFPPYSIGKKEIAKPVVEKFILDFSGTDTPIIIPSGTCKSMIANYYQNLFADSSLHLKMRNVQNRAIDLLDFILENVPQDHSFNLPAPLKVALVKSCKSGEGCSNKTTLLNIISKVNGLEVIDYPLTNDCCGYGYAFAHEFDKLSFEIGKKKIESILTTNAEAIVVDDLMCLIQTDSILKELGANIPAKHIVDLLTSN